MMSDVFSWSDSMFMYYICILYIKYIYIYKYVYIYIISENKHEKLANHHVSEENSSNSTGVWDPIWSREPRRRCGSELQLLACPGFVPVTR